MTDLVIYPAQIRAARALLGMTQNELAIQARITRKTLARLENGISLSRDTTAMAVMAALESRGVIFIFEGRLHGVASPRPAA